MKWELEDLGFRYVDPEKYKEIAELLSQRRADRQKQIDGHHRQGLTRPSSQPNIQAEITGRPKHIYSIYKKNGAQEVALL